MIAAGAFKQGIDLAIGVAIGVLLIKIVQVNEKIESVSKQLAAWQRSSNPNETQREIM